jgi:fimbrial chaperone protein
VRPLLLTAILALGCLQTTPCSADGFAALVSPPRFELSSRTGSTVRQVIEITNKSNSPSKFRVHTADFTLGADYGIAFHDELVPGSCRPWVSIERPTVALPAGATVRYRFEVAVPADAPAGECRFGIMIEADEPAMAGNGAVQLPIVGRIGIIVYVIVGDGAPKIEVFGPTVVDHNGQKVPALRVFNSGNAHTRMGGFLNGKDAAGTKYDFTPSDLPILPGEERAVLLIPSTSDNQNPRLAFPVTVQGKLEFGDQSLALDERFK